jgi:hypothetical protein
LSNQLHQALSRGDIASAKNAFAALARAASTSSVSLTAAGHSLQADLATVREALEAGDLPGAQSSFQQLEQDLQTLQSAPPAGQTVHQVHARVRAASASVDQATVTTPGHIVDVLG